ncbi:MAG TPA: hypothetical protein VK654_00960 [Nitrospirota bacterium]|nr:hypothetical protein [Nitrospirota bacterium]
MRKEEYDDIDSIAMVYCEPSFKDTLENLRSKGGQAADAAAKADEFRAVLAGRNNGGRTRFRFTRKGEYRIKNCRKVDLGNGYRIVCIQKDQRLVLFYIGTHDDCFRWIERRRTAEYDVNQVPDEAWENVALVRQQKTGAVVAEPSEDTMSEQYEAGLQERADDEILRIVFAGIVNSRR